MDKSRAVAAVIDELKVQHARMLHAARLAEKAASDPESRAENKYDTRGLESSYLAAGQGEQVETISRAIATIAATAFPKASGRGQIVAGSLVEVDFGGTREALLLAPAGGGLTIELDGIELTVLGPGAPLREQLLGLRVGETLESPPLTIRGIR